MNWLGLSCLIIAPTCLALGIFAFWKNPKGQANKVFLWLNLVTTWWTVWLFLVLNAPSQSVAVLCAKALHFGVIPIPFLYAHFVLAVSQQVERNRYILRFGYALAGLFILANITPYFVSDVRPIPELNIRFYVRPGIFYHLYLVAFATFPLYAFGVGLKALRALTGYRRIQLRYVLMASVPAFLGGTTTYFPVYGINIYPYGNFLVVLYPIIFTYAIVQYRLLDINVALARLILFVFCYAPLLLLPFVLGEALESTLTAWMGGNWWMAPMVAEAFVAVLGLSIYRTMTKRWENRILTEQREVQELLLEAAQGMLDVLNPYQLIDLIAKIVMRHVKVTHVAVYYQEQKGMPYHLKSFERSADSTDLAEPLMSIEPEDRLISYLEAVREPVLTEEMARSVQEGKTSHLKSVLAHLNDLKATLVVPNFLKKGRLVGFLLLGPKRSGEVYSPDDLKVFEILADQAAIAIQHARFYTRSLSSEMFQGLKELLSSNAHEFHNILHRATSVLSFLSLYPESVLPPERVKELYQKANGILEQGKRWTEEIRGYQALMKDPTVKAYSTYRQLFEPLLGLPQKSLSEGQFPKERIERLRVALDCPQDLPKIEGLPTLPDVFRHLVLNACWSMADNCPEGGTITIKARCPDRKTLEIHMTDPGELLVPLLQNPNHLGSGAYLPHRGKLGAVHLFLARLIVLEHSGNLEVSTTEDGQENLIAVQVPLTFTPPPLKDEEAGGEATEAR